jgi:hypothetical protein
MVKLNIKIDKNNLDNNNNFEELKLMLLNLSNNTIPSNISFNPGKSQEVKSIPQELLKDINAESDVNNAYNI